MNTNLQESAKLLACVEVVTRTPVTCAVIWLHGLGADGHNFANIVSTLKLPASAGIRFVFPHAPIRPVTINQGMAMRAWYDIDSLIEPQADIEGIEASCQAVWQLIQQQQALGIDTHHIVLAGFSQGGAIALHAALRAQWPLAGVLALSTYLPAESAIPAAVESKNQALPIFLAHGIDDVVIPMQSAVAAYHQLLAKGYQVAWEDYAMDHEVCMPEINDIRAWLISCLNLC